jgi:tRNA(Arg) A34 adenosine deaminase TadA
VSPDRRLLDAAIAEAVTGRDEGGIPIGSVLVIEDRIVGRGQPTAHSSQPTATPDR